MLKLPTEECLERELENAGLGLGERFYGEDLLAGGDMDDMLYGSIERKAKEYVKSVDIEHELENPKMRKPIEEVKRDFSEYLGEDISDEEAFMKLVRRTALVLGTPAQKVSFANIVDIPFFQREVIDPSTGKYLEIPKVEYLVFADSRFSEGGVLEYRMRADEIVRDSDRNLSDAWVSIGEGREEVSVGCQYPDLKFEITWGLEEDEVHPLIDSPGPLADYKDVLKLLHGTPYDPEVAAKMVVGMIEAIRGAE